MAIYGHKQVYLYFCILPLIEVVLTIISSSTARTSCISSLSLLLFSISLFYWSSFSSSFSTIQDWQEDKKTSRLGKNIFVVISNLHVPQSKVGGNIYKFGRKSKNWTSRSSWSLFFPCLKTRPNKNVQTQKTQCFTGLTCHKTQNSKIQNSLNTLMDIVSLSLKIYMYLH